MENKTLKENIVDLLTEASQVMYGTSKDVVSMFNGDLQNLMHMAVLFHCAFDYDGDNATTDVVKVDFDENYDEKGLWVYYDPTDEWESWDGGWQFVGTMAPSRKAIMDAVDAATNVNNPKREWLKKMGIDWLLNVTIFD